MAAAARWVRSHPGGVAVTSVFVVSRLILLKVAGLEFDNRPLNDAFQLLDRGHLSDGLLGNLLHLHTQPPLFNLFIGVVLQAPLDWQTPIFQAAYLGIGLALALCLHALLRGFGAPPVLAVTVALLFTLSPSVFLYENWLHYDYPVTLLLCLAALALQRYERDRSARKAAVFAALIAAVVLTRSLFHIGWFVICAVAVFVAARGASRRQVAAALALPAVAVFGLHLQRLVMFGTFSSSSTLGISLAKITIWQLPHSERVPLVYEGKLGRVSLVHPLSPASSYFGVVPQPRPTGIAVLDAEQKARHRKPRTQNGLFRTNANNSIFLAVSDAYMADAMYTIRHHPDAYLRGVGTAVETYFRPTSDFFTLYDNRQRLGAFNHWSNRALGVMADGRGPAHLPDADAHYRLGRPRTAWFVVAAYAVAFVAGGVTLARHMLRRRPDGEPLLVTAFLWFTMVYVFVVSNALEVGENNRFRLYSDPLVLALLVSLASNWWRRRTAAASSLRTNSDTAGTQPLSVPA